MLNARLKDGSHAAILEDGNLLEVHDHEGTLLFSVRSPEHSTFYLFQKDYEHGMCPIVAFSYNHKPDGPYGWGDWYYRVDLPTRSLIRLGPWK